MDKVVHCLLLLAGICCSSAEVNSEEFVTDTTATTPVHTTPLTETTQPIIVDSTSDSLRDIYPHLTEFYTTTTSTAAPKADDDPNSTVVPEENGDADSTTATGEDGDSDSTAAPKDNDPNSTAPGEDGNSDSTAAPGEDGDSDSTAAPKDNDPNSTAPGEDGDPDLTAAPKDNDPNSIAPGEDGDPDSTAVPGEDVELNSTEIEDGEPDSTAAPQNDDSLNEEHKALSSSPESVCEGELSHTDMQLFEKAMNAFSRDLLKQVELESSNPNVVVSPFSIALGLLQLALGAENQTEKMILETLHVESLQCLHEKLQKVINRLAGTSLNVATRMYVKKGLHIKSNFLKRSERLYGTKPVNLKQHMKQNVEAINKWVKDATKGNIPNFLSTIPSNVVLMLLNAIHFKGMWRNRFDPAKTKPDVFNINDEEMVMVDMMQSVKYPLSYFAHEKLDSQVARLPFKGNMSFVVVIPRHMNWNLSRILDNLNRTALYNRFHKEKPTIIKVPKLNLNFKLELTHVLSNLGLGQLFNHPNLKGISDEPLYVSSVEHQSTLQLNEDGAEASAATAIIMSRSLSTFSINRPFLFFLFDDITGLILFQGYVRNPKPGFQKEKKESSFIPEIKKMPKGSIPK